MPEVMESALPADTNTAMPALERTQDMFNTLTVRRLHAQYRLHGPLHSEAFMGNLFRGQLGAWWHGHAPDSYACLMDEGSGGRFWALCAPWADAAQVPAGAMLDLRLTLIGKAVQHEAAAVDALVHLADRGLGPRDSRGGRAPATLEGVWLEPLGATDNTSPSLLDILLCPPDVSSSAEGTSTIDVNLLRPLRIKADGRVFVGPPSMSQLIRRTLGRVVQLLPAAPAEADWAAQQPDAEDRSRLFHADEHATWMAAAAAAPCTDHNLQGWEWRRHSRRTGQSIALEGVSGRLRYGVAQPMDKQHLMPWLRVADWLQIGTKTTFGFGALNAQ